MIKFGPSGNDKLFYEQGHSQTIEVFEWLNKMGLDLFEYSFGRGVLLKNETAQLMSDKAKENKISVSVHAPYYINLATDSPLQIINNEKYMLDSLEKLKIFNGTKCVVHSGSVRDFERKQAIDLIKTNILPIIDKMKYYGYDDLNICLETMGKFQQIGNVEEILDICSVHQNLTPTLDFGHLNCLAQGGLKQKEDFIKILQTCKNKLSKKQLDNLHIHFSKIQFSSKGELKHLTLDDEIYGPEFPPLAKALIELKLCPTIICESKEIMAQDALKLKNMYLSLAK